MTEGWRIKYSIVVWDKILIFSLFQGCFIVKVQNPCGIQIRDRIDI